MYIHESGEISVYYHEYDMSVFSGMLPYDSINFIVSKID